MAGSQITRTRRSGTASSDGALTSEFLSALRDGYRMEEFEFSTAYLQFWDKMEKANLYLESIIKPQLIKGLTWVNSSHDSIRGRIHSFWSETEEGILFEIIIPPDTTAEIMLPAGKITESGKPLAEAEGITVVDPATNRLKAGSGRYRFLVAP